MREGNRVDSLEALKKEEIVNLRSKYLQERQCLKF